MDRLISSLSEWEENNGEKRKEAQRLIEHIDGVWSVSVIPGTRGRPLDAIFITAEPEIDRRFIVRTVEILIKNVLNLMIDYRIVSIR